LITRCASDKLLSQYQQEVFPGKMIEEIAIYNQDVMAGRPATKAAPLFGQRLSALRKARGLTQRELAEALGTTREMVDYYERRAINPAL
jgi:DNA-binding transcriptional regulator YiaG